MKKNNKSETTTSPTDLQRLIADFESVSFDLSELALSDKEERELVEEKRKELHELSNVVQEVLQGNERSRREKLVKLSNIQELLRPILFPNNNCNTTCDPSMEQYRSVFLGAR